MFLLDVNLLIALLDEWHPHHQAATAFFPTAQLQGWATCPLTENGFLRIVGHINYVNGPGSPQGARVLLDALCASAGHSFWEDSLSMRDATRFASLPTASRLTDVYLLALAVERKARLATFDRRIDPTLLSGAGLALAIVGDDGKTSYVPKERR